MRIWHLDREYDRLLATVASAREERRTGVRTVVQGIKEEILNSGEKAIVDYTRRFDGWKAEYSLRISKEEAGAAASSVSSRDRSVLQGMMANVTRFHKSQKERRRTYRRNDLTVTEEAIPVERALVYVPGGKAPYPSSLVMGVVPAKVAGVREIFATTPTQGGQVNPYIAAAALMLGVTDLYRASGAQAVYGFSHGIGSLPKVDMIVGPGNAYVEEAKRDVYGQVGIDMLAGPSELVVLAAEKVSPQTLAWDLFSQAEHDEMAMVGLFSPSLENLYDLLKSIERLLPLNERREIIDASLKANGFLVHYTKIEDAISAIDRIAPEHLEVIGDEGAAEKIRYSGITYVGPHTCVAMGDYYIGTNHVLPTGAAGRFSSGLSVERFTKRRVLVKIGETFLRKYGENAARLAEIEGLHAHSRAIRARKELPE
jgi:histidinol dehydrogenase